MGETTAEIEKYFRRETVQKTNADDEVVDVEETICNHCQYRWEARVENPKRCPKCQKDLWNWRD